MRNKSNVFPQSIHLPSISPYMPSSLPSPLFPISPFLFLFREKSFLNSKLLSSLHFQRPIPLKSILTSLLRSPLLAPKGLWVQQDEDSAWPFFKFVLKTVLSSVPSLVQQIKPNDRMYSTFSRPPLRLSRRV